MTTHQSGTRCKFYTNLNVGTTRSQSTRLGILIESHIITARQVVTMKMKCEVVYTSTPSLLKVPN